MRKTTSLITTRFHTISKLESLEEYYLKLLQLHMSWQDENQLKECHQSYEEKYMEVIYSKLNDAQKCFFSCIITYITKCKTTFKNNDKEPDQFYLHLTGGAGVKKEFSYKCPK